MSLIQIQEDPTVVRLREVSSNLDRVAKFAHAAVGSLNSAFAEFWGNSAKEAQALLDRLGPEQVQRVFQLHAESSASLNAMLDAIDDERYSNRANTDGPFNVEFDGTKFIVSNIPD